MKVLVVYYSRTGVTERVAAAICSMIKADYEVLIDKTNREGIVGYIKSGRDAIMKKRTEYELVKFHPEKYDLIIIGTPVWANKITPAVRSYLEDNKQLFKKIAFFCTMGKSGNVFEEMEQIIRKKPEATLALTSEEVLRYKSFEITKKMLDQLKLDPIDIEKDDVRNKVQEFRKYKKQIEENNAIEQRNIKKNIEIKEKMDKKFDDIKKEMQKSRMVPMPDPFEEKKKDDDKEEGRENNNKSEIEEESEKKS